VNRVIQLFIIIMTIASISNGLSIKESVIVNNSSGTLYSYTHSGQANDFVHAAGSQNYTKILKSGEDELSLSSIYSLTTTKNDHKKYENGSFNILYKNHTINRDGIGMDFLYSQNQYAISMISPSGLETYLSIKGLPKEQNGFTATNRIEFITPKLGSSASEIAKREASSEYIASGAGILSSSVLNRNTGKHPSTITLTEVASSDFNYEFGVADEFYGFGSDASSLLGNLGDVNISSEKGVSDPAADLSNKFNKKLINATEYINLLEKYWDNGIVNDEYLLTKSKELLDAKQINDKRYSDIFARIQSKEVGGIESEAKLTKYTNQFLREDINKTIYLKLTDDMWKNGEIEDIAYLNLLNDLVIKGMILVKDRNDRYELIQKKWLGEPGVA
jgi:hypothetical protein